MEATAMLEGGSEQKRMSIDEVLRLYAGEFGWWQMKHFVLTNTAWALEAFHAMVMIFADHESEWRCAAGTAGAACRAAGAAAADVCGLPAGSWEWVGGPAASTVSQWGLMCGERYKVGVAQSAFFAGGMIGAGVFGHLSDSFMGRKGALTVVIALNAVLGLLTALSPSFSIYLLLRLLTGFSSGGIGLCAFVLSTEPVGPSIRGLAGMSTFYFFSLGLVLLSLVAFLVRSWRILYVITSLPSIIFLVAILPFISESPRWYLVRRRTTEAMQVMKEIARANGRDLPNEVSLTLDGKGLDSESGTLIDVVRSRLTRLRFLLSVLMAFSCAIIYYGLTLNVVNLKISIYASVFLNAVAEMPALLLSAMLLGRVGRRPLGVGTMWLSGVSSLIAALAERRIIRLAGGVMGIFCMAAAYNLLFIYTAELFPTTVRNAALGGASQASHLGSILAPLVVVLGEKVPFAVFAASGALGGVVALFLPETMDKPLYDTLAGMEKAEGEANVTTQTTSRLIKDGVI